MKTAHECIDNAITDLERLKLGLKRKKTKQISNSEERSIIKATALAWFNNYRPRVVNIIGNELSKAVDETYKKILSASDRATSRTRYYSLLKSIKIYLSQIRGHVVMATTSQSTPLTTDEPPKFDPLITDSQMQRILTNRWRECCNCLSANAPLAATVMMGGLLEALLLAKVNKSDKSLFFKAKSAPKDNATGKTLTLKEWTLRNYIDVAHELKWISQSAKEVGEVLRDYRNYVHPYKELSHNVALVDDDARLFWEIVKNIGRQIIRNSI